VVQSRLQHQPQANGFEVLIVIAGAGSVGDEETKAGEAWYVSAGAAPFDIAGKMTLLRTVT
jgi:hypothetical protein